MLATVTEFAKKAQISRRAVYNYIDKGIIERQGILIDTKEYNWLILYNKNMKIKEKK